MAAVYESCASNNTQDATAEHQGLPPLICPFVEIVDMDRAVSIVTVHAIIIIRQASPGFTLGSFLCEDREDYISLAFKRK